MVVVAEFQLPQLMEKQKMDGMGVVFSHQENYCAFISVLRFG
jgi:hypothetical protein